MTRLRGGGKGERIAHEPRGREVARVDSAGIARRLSLFLPVFAFSLQNGATLLAESLRSFLDKSGKRKEERGRRKAESGKRKEEAEKCHKTWFRLLSPA